MSEAAIAQAAAHAELQHEGWQKVSFYQLEKDFSYGAMGHVRTTVRINTYTGAWEAETRGGTAPDHLIDGWVQSAVDVINKWPPKIEQVFSKWRDLPRGWELWTEGANLNHATSELALAPGDDANGQTTLSNTRLAGDLDNLRLRAGDLNGHYAETFREKYVSRLGDVIANQGALVSLLAVAVQTQAEIWDQTYVSLLDLEQAAERAMEASAPSGGDGNDSLVAVLSVAGAILAGIAAVPSAGATLPVAVGLLGGGFGAASAIISHNTEDPGEKDVPLGAGHPDQVFEKLQEALDDLNLQIEGQERDLVTLLSAAHALTEVPIDRSDVDLRRPGIVGAQSDVLEAQQLLTVDEETIAKITELWIPTISGDLRSAQADLDVDASGFRRSGDVGLTPTGAWPEFQALQTAMHRLLGDTATELDGAATALQAAAQDIGLSDANVNARYERQAEEILTWDL